MSSLARILPFLSPIANLLLDPSITDVMVNAGGRQVFVEQDGMLRQIHGCTIEEALLDVAIKQIARSCSQEISAAQPILDARLDDGSRVAACFRPRSVDGATLTIRRFGRRYSLVELVESGTMSVSDAGRLEAAMLARSTVLISGGTGTGKTTLLNACLHLIPDGERLLLLEDTSEIHVTHSHVVRFESGVAETFGIYDAPRPAVSMSDLLKASLRHRPDRIILGEVRSPSVASDLLQALNTGHRGGLSTIHANSARQALTRLRHLVHASGAGWPDESVREAIQDAIQLVVHLDRVGPHRRVTELYDIGPGTVV